VNGKKGDLSSGLESSIFHIFRKEGRRDVSSTRSILAGEKEGNALGEQTIHQRLGSEVTKRSESFHLELPSKSVTWTGF